MSLYKKYRPTSFDEIYGNEATVKTLKSSLEKEDPPHVYMFHGPAGCGKTTLGRIVAKKLGAKGTSFREIDSADFRGVDTIRDIRKKSNFKALEGDVMVWLLDECHQLTNTAQEALLKGLEDPPEHVYYILCTTEPEKLKDTFNSRCSKYKVGPLEKIEMVKLLRDIAGKEDVSLTKPLYEKIMSNSGNKPRDAIQILEQVIDADPEQREEIAEHSAEMQAQTIELCRSLLRNEPWSKVKNILKGLKREDPERIRRAILGYMKSVLLNGANNRAGFIMGEFMQPFYDSGFPELVYACYVVIKA